jgi:hypothetical protein
MKLDGGLRHLRGFRRHCLVQIVDRQRLDRDHGELQPIHLAARALRARSLIRSCAGRSGLGP